MSLNDRLRRLEQQHDEAAWCRCEYDRERHRVEQEWAWTTGEPTPGACDRCGGRRVRIQYVEWETLRAPP